ncbi:helix-turn-helix domain-containing protein [Flavobacterium sp. RSB2_4_14]|uniref:helix-turn-helix domain-containing protein n=1 Tax=Flavobacterium sp. RSB2_4_14 TaxID=3447665 RepID=UPI003F35244E
MKVKVIIERGNDGSYGAYIGSNNVPFGILGDGKTVQEAKADFLNSYQEIRAYYLETNKKIIEYDFDFQFDIASFLAYYGSILSLAGMERLTGVNQGQLSHYVTGRRKPSRRTIEKIENKLHEFGKELNQVEFI